MGYTDSTTEQAIDGKAYLLKSTDGEEFVDPARLFGGESPVLEDLARRVYALEEALGMTKDPEPDPAGEEQGEPVPDPAQGS